MMLAVLVLLPTSRARKAHDIISQGLQILKNLTHRGATGADPLQGDGAGILIQLPDAFFLQGIEDALHRFAGSGEYGSA